MLKKKIIPLTIKEIKFHEKQKVCQISKKSFVTIKIRKANITLIRKSEIIVITPENIEKPAIASAI